MKVEIKLKNPKYCDGCPFLFDEFKHILGLQNTFCNYFGKNLVKLGGYHNHVKRLEKCIRKNGK